MNIKIKKSEYKFFIAIFMILFSINFAYAMNLSEYEYVSKVKVNCEEYKGFARFELPNEYNSLNSPKSYMDIDHFIQKVYNKEHYLDIDNWFIKQINGHDTKEVEKIFDNNYETYLVEENKNQIEFLFELPASSKVDKISLDLKDSLIEKIRIYDSFGKEIDFVLNTNNFHYELLLDNSIYTNQLKFVIDYKDIIKIKEIVFFNLKTYKEKSYAYIYVNNDCMKEHLFYFGRYGESFSRMGPKTLPVEFSVNVETFKNILYDSDFDNDNILNDNDNCLFVSNNDQKDINYNQIGDACEDDDRDGIVNSIDNCINDYNRNQLDNDKDGIGNVCDDNDERFFEENKFLVFIFAGIIAIIFFLVAIIVMKNKG